MRLTPKVPWNVYDSDTFRGNFTKNNDRFTNWTTIHTRGVWQTSKQWFWNQHSTENLLSLTVFFFYKTVFLRGKKCKCLLNRIVFYMMFFIPMATLNNSRSDLLNKNSHDYLLSHRTETALNIIKNVFEETKPSKNA